MGELSMLSELTSGPCPDGIGNEPTEDFVIERNDSGEEIYDCDRNCLRQCLGS